MGADARLAITPIQQQASAELRSCMAITRQAEGEMAKTLRQQRCLSGSQNLLDLPPPSGPIGLLVD